jgi:DNA repair exonuclease SbcCD ATPase subunit
MVKPQLTRAIRGGSNYPLPRPNLLMKAFRPNFDEQYNIGPKRSAALEVKDAAVDFNGRRSPKIMTIPRDRVREFKNTISKLSAELSLRCTQVADLYNLQQQQANDLTKACDEIDRLSKSINALQDTITHHENETATRENKLIQLGNENITLRSQLNNSLKESAAVLQRSLSVETAFNDRELAIVSAGENYAEIKTELTAALAETFRLSAAAEVENQRHRNELNRQNLQFNEHIKKIDDVAVERTRQIEYLEKSRAELASRCDDLSKAVVALECEKANARQEHESQAVVVLETLLRVERESAECKINELNAEIRRERAKHFNTERNLAGLRESFALLLPKLGQSASQ